MSLIHQNSFSKEELIACGQGELFGPGNPTLPTDNMLMVDRITHISHEGGEFGKRRIINSHIYLNPGARFFGCSLFWSRINFRAEFGAELRSIILSDRRINYCARIWSPPFLFFLGVY